MRINETISSIQTGISKISFDISKTLTNVLKKIKLVFERQKPVIIIELVRFRPRTTSLTAILKPIDPEALKAALESILPRHTFRRLPPPPIVQIKTHASSTKPQTTTDSSLPNLSSLLEE